MHEARAVTRTRQPRTWRYLRHSTATDVTSHYVEFRDLAFERSGCFPWRSSLFSLHVVLLRGSAPPRYSTSIFFGYA